MQQLTETANKASLAVPKRKVDPDNPTALTPEKVELFTGCVKRIIGLRQELVELLTIGHPYLKGKTRLRFPEEGEGLSASTQKDLDWWLKWAEKAKEQWCKAVDDARLKHSIMSCIPARNITKIVLAILANQPAVVPPLLSIAVKSPAYFEPDPDLNDAFKQSQSLQVREGAHEQFLERMVDVLKEQVVSEGVAPCFSPLHKVAKQYRLSRLSRSSEDSTSKSRRREDPNWNPGQVLLIQEEVSHETGLDKQSTSALTVLSVLLPNGVGPGPDNLLLCDGTTKKDDVLRFLHRVTHLTRSASAAGCQSQVLGVFVHVDCLQQEVRQVLESEVQAMQVAGGKRKTAPLSGGAEVEVRLVFTVTRHAPKLLIENLKKDICKLQQIKILKLESIQHFLEKAVECLGDHQVVMSDFAGDGKTFAIRQATGWHEASHSSIVWGGAQSRGQAARALKEVGHAQCVHLEFHSFEEGGGVDADTLLWELLVFRCVFDPEGSEWVRLSQDLPIFVEVANSIKISHGDAATQLTLLSAPVLGRMPRQLKIDSNSPFTFGPADLDHPATAPVSARNFALAGSALLLGNDRKRLVGGQDEGDVVFHLLHDFDVVVSAKHAELLQFQSNNVIEAARLALQAAWQNSQEAAANRNQAPVPTKATIMSFFAFLGYLTSKLARFAFLLQLRFQDEPGQDIDAILRPVLKDMIVMAAAMCLRSSAAEAQDQQRQKNFAAVHDPLCEALARRVQDVRVDARTVWAFNTGGSLRFIGNCGEVPAGLRGLWETLRSTLVKIETIVDPPRDLEQASQDELQRLLLVVMSGHGFKKEEDWGWVIVERIR